MIFLKKPLTGTGAVRSCLFIVAIVSIFTVLGMSSAEDILPDDSQKTEAIQTDVISNILADDAVGLPAPTISVNNPIESTPERIELAWDQMDEAASYRFELCADNQCMRILHTHNNLREPKVILQNLKPQAYFWRINSVNTDGVTGSPSSAQPLIINPAPQVNTQATDKQALDTNQSGSINEPDEHLPWYVWLVFAAYILFFLRVIYWYLNK